MGNIEEAIHSINNLNAELMDNNRLLAFHLQVCLNYIQIRHLECY